MKQLSEWGSFYWVVPVVIAALGAVLYVDRKPWRRKALWIMLGVWFVAVVYLMFLYRLPPRQGRLTFDIFHMYRDAVRWNGSVGENQALRQILFNVLLYIPFGTIVRSLTGKAWLTAVLGIMLSVVTEMLQYWTGLGWADIDDVISNSAGLLLGVIIQKRNQNSDNNQR